MNTVPISHLSLIKISGPDAQTFLQGQLTNDVAKLSNSWQYAGYCNPKGRLLALLQIWRQEENFYALISSDLVEATSKRLRMYVMRSKVSIEELADCKLIGLLQHSSLAPTLARLNLPPEDAACEQSELGEYRHGDLIQNQKACVLIINKRALIVHKAGTEDSTEPSLETNSRWLQADISEGVPQVCAATVEQFIPQMLNLDILGGVSFKKGCYTGQEIVARMHYLGKLKQRMFSCDISNNIGIMADINDVALPEAGDKVYSDSALEKAIGTLVSVDLSSRQVLAVLRLNSLEDCLRLNANYQLNLTAQQAYSIPERQ
ncbi:MAG: folate-binding protein YgfZ [Arenicella sp.]|jgi:folate-binding protein YgfZ